LFGRITGWLLFTMDRRDRERARQNLHVIFQPNPLPKNAQDRILRSLFRHIATSAFETFILGRIVDGNLQDFLDIQNYEVLFKALDQGKGVLALTAHLGNWELLGRVGTRFGLDMGTVIKRQYNPYTDRWLKRLREKQGIKCFYNENGVQAHIGNHLKRNGVLGLLADAAYHNRPIFVPFFGVDSATTDGPAKLHLWYGSPIVFAFAVKQESGRYLLAFDGPYCFEGEKGDLRTRCTSIMAEVNRRYEGLIQKYPDQWFAMLTPRWEPRPEDFQ
jgi:KDO2-lipid IV(A) lauroyltransferase